MAACPTKHLSQVVEAGSSHSVQHLARTSASPHNVGALIPSITLVSRARLPRGAAAAGDAAAPPSTGGAGGLTALKHAALTASDAKEAAGELEAGSLHQGQHAGLLTRINLHSSCM